jgi:hypothetical protein
VFREAFFAGTLGLSRTPRPPMDASEASTMRDEHRAASEIRIGLGNFRPELPRNNRNWRSCVGNQSLDLGNAR